MSLFTRTRQYRNPRPELADCIVHMSHRRWFIGGGLINLCFYDGAMWHQADADILDDGKAAVEWLTEMHYRVLASR